MKIQKQSTAALRKRRNALLRQLPPLHAILRGSLIERYKRCAQTAEFLANYHRARGILAAICETTRRLRVPPEGLSRLALRLAFSALHPPLAGRLAGAT